MKTKLTQTLLAAFLVTALTANLRAQLVPDGITAFYAVPTDISPSDLVVGTNGGNTVLYIVSPGTVTNANGTIGLNATSTNNQVHAENSGAVWQNNGDLNIGFDGSGNQLMVSNGAVVANTGDGYVGWRQNASNNLAVVTGTGSLWTNGGDLHIGNRGSGNHLVVSNGAVLTSASSSLGYTVLANNNRVTVTGTNSQWRVSYDLIVGYDDNTNNQVVIRDGGLAMSSFASIGDFSTTANKHSVLVADPGSLWTNSGDLYVGATGSGNQLVVTNGGTVMATNVTLGFSPSSTNNRATVGGGNLIVTNFDGTGTLDIRRGTNVLNAGLIRTDNLLLTNSSGFFDFNGGTLITRGGTVSNGHEFVVGASSNIAAILDLRSNAPLVLNNSLILGANTAAGNQLLVTDGGMLSSSGPAFIGLTASNNLVVVSGSGSGWTSSGNLLVGNNSAGNQLLVSAGGVMANSFGILGNTSIANNNLALVTDPGSLWNNSSGVSVGSSGSGNQLVVSNGAVVASSFGSVGTAATASNNIAVVTGVGSLWTNSGDIVVGSSGKGNQLVVSDSGTVQAANAYVGANSTGNRVTLSGGNLIVTNSGGTGTLNILRGTNVLNAGLLQTDNLLLNNGALSVFQFNGGTLLTRASTVNNGSPFVVGDGSSSATYQLAGNGSHTFNNGLTLSKFATLTGNGTVAGVLTVQNGGTVMPGNSVGKLVLNSSPVLQGAVLMEISKTGATLTNDQIQVTASLTYGGSLVVSNLGPDALVAGDSFSLFSASGYGSAFTNVSLPTLHPGLEWTNKLSIDGSIAVVPNGHPFISVVKSGTNLVFNVSGGSPGSAFALLTSTNVALPLSSWTTNSTGNFDGLGNITLTNGINPDEPQRYFNVRMP